MDIFESLISVLVDLFNDILNIDERALITEVFKDFSVTDMHIIGEKDRRIVYASLTDKGIAAYRHHENFHKDMIGHITKDLTKEEAEVLTKTFIRLEDFFHQIP